MQRWHNIDIELFDHDTIGESESVRVRVARSPAGVQRDAINVTIPKSLRAAQEALGADSLDLRQTIELGKSLSEVLLPAEAGELFENSYATLPADHGLRIRIELRSLPLADLPWEFTYRQAADYDAAAPERGFLALNRRLSIVRFEPVAQAPMSCKPLHGKPVNVALLLANPDIPGWARLDLEREIKAVESALSDEPEVQLSVLRNATEQSLNDSLDDRPHVFHFAGHGRFKVKPAAEFGVYVGAGELLFEDAQGELDAIPAKELATKMRGSGVRLAVLNSCESARRDTLNAFTGVAPTLVRDGVPAVVAMQYNIRDQHALQFARRFYRNLARQKPIDDALNAARIAMFNLDGKYSRDWGLPVLYLRSDEAILFPSNVRSASALSKLGLLGGLNIGLATLLVIALALFYAWHIEPRLPLGNLFYGVLSVACLAGLGFLRYIAGDSLRISLLNWFRRKAATTVLGTALVASTAGLMTIAEPSMVRIVAGTSFLRNVAKFDLEQPLKTFRLEVKFGADVASQESLISEDFRRPGVVISTSTGLLKRLQIRYHETVIAALEAYLRRIDQYQNMSTYMPSWQTPPQELIYPRLGTVQQLTVFIDNGADIQACKTVNVADVVSVITVEKDDEC